MAHPQTIDEPLWRECVAASQKGGTIDGGVRVHLVDGNHVKIRHDMDFVEGGNGLEDKKLCGKHEILLDAHLHPSQRPFVLYHEAVERRDMLKGMSYGKAHQRANIAEKKLRIRHTTKGTGR